MSLTVSPTGQISGPFRIAEPGQQVCSAIVDCKNRTPDRVDDGRYTVVRTTNIRSGEFSIRGSYPSGCSKRS